MPRSPTRRRLGIGADRLQLYLGGLRRQLAAAAPELAQRLDAGHPDAARTQLARLGEGCRTLGLFGAAASLDALQTGALLDHAAIAQALNAAGQAVLRQLDAAEQLG
jgi:two-component system, chemotaxis family, chemotaxis protein CheY